MSFGSTAKQIIATVAPVLGTALGGPFGGLAGGILAKYLGTSDPKAQEAAIASADPAVLLQLKQARDALLCHRAVAPCKLCKGVGKVRSRFGAQRCTACEGSGDQQ